MQTCLVISAITKKPSRSSVINPSKYCPVLLSINEKRKLAFITSENKKLRYRFRKQNGCYGQDGNVDIWLIQKMSCRKGTDSVNVLTYSVS